MLDLPSTNLARQRAEGELLHLGFSKVQIDSVRFRAPRGMPFLSWSIKHDDVTFGLQNASRPLIIVATARWLDSDPPHDRDFEDACQYVALYLAEPDLEAGQRHREAQRQRSRKPRGRLTEDGSVTLSGVIAKLVHDHPDERPKQLWPHFLSKLDDEGLAPIEKTSGKDGSDPQVHYGDTGKPRTLTFRRFTALVRKARKKMAR